MKSYLWFVFLGLAAIHVQASQCLQAENLQRLDQQYEEALRVGNVQFLHELLAEDFIWVHTLAVDIENKQALLTRLRQEQEITQSRTSSEITQHRLHKTVVLSGVSSVKKLNPDGQTVRVYRYRFLRTYVASGKHCRLLAVQTMNISSSDEPAGTDK